tara:strand:- start:4103 stop:6493 length:2391 start_codon:yes stop_codon:yes gene_type:complete
MQFNIVKNDYTKILFIITLSTLVDNFYISQITNPPAWDQGYHLSNVFKMFNILNNGNINIFNKIDHLLNVTDSYRGPITYFISSLFIKIFKNSYHFSYLSNQIFNLITIISIFNLSKYFKNKSIGIWSAIIFTFSYLIIEHRSDYLIDLSLTSFSILNLLFFTKWYFNDSRNLKYSILSGISLALVFLTKPTGIALFFLPFIFIITKKFKNRKNLSFNIKEIFLFIFCFTIFIYPWFSKHWITIISSTINAWNWGINYQDGLSIKSIGSWVYYFKNLPSIFGIINFSIISIIFIIEIIFQNKSLKIKVKNINKINFWFLVYFSNCYLLVSLMSTKDIRFILPLYPLFCIYLSLFINTRISTFFSIKFKKIILIISICISLIFSNGINLLNLMNNGNNFWPHNEIIKEIKNKNLNLSSTLAVLPDTKEINTFNLEAEASRQGEYVSVRQIISNENSYKNDLKYFDWFLVKTGYQGIMTNEAKKLLNNHLLNNSSFVIDKKWILADNSQLILLRRESINSNLSIKKSISNGPIINIKQINNGLNITFSGEGKYIKDSNLLIDFNGEGLKKYVNVSLANGFFHQSFNEKEYYELSQNLDFKFPKNFPKKLNIKARLLNKKGDIIPLKILNNEMIINDQFINSDYIQMVNRISNVELLSTYLRNGEFKNLFDLVGIINQSDPKQIYLRNAEIIFSQRYKENKKLKDAYSILISQILQKKVSEAEKTINIILKTDKKNGNAYLIKSIINIYLLDKKDARFSINKTKNLEKSLESEEILNVVEGLTYILEMQFVNAYKSFST